MSRQDIFKVDLQGLSNLLPHDNLGWIINELVQNFWDTDSPTGYIELDPMLKRKNKIKITVTDTDPNGFLDLAHAFTLFAKSGKLATATKRGRFNLGEKLVIAYAVATGGWVRIQTVNGGFYFDEKGRKTLRTKREAGSKIEVVCRGTLVQYDQLVWHTKSLIPPNNCDTHLRALIRTIDEPYNHWLAKPTLISAAMATLPTVIADEDGVLRKTKRKTDVHIYEPREGETGMIYEMGIPVVSSGTPYHIDIQQKIPLAMERDNVTPSYRAKVHTLILNATADRLTKEEVAEDWVSTGLANRHCSTEALNEVLDTKYGSKRVVHDPNHPESSAVAVSKGYTVVYGGSETKQTWQNIRKKTPIQSASSVFDTTNNVAFSSEGKDVTIPKDEWSFGMEDLANFSQCLFSALFSERLSVQFLNDPRGYEACFSSNNLSFNYRALRASKVNDWKKHKVEFLDLIIHEFAHRFGDSHFSEKYWRATTKIGAQTAHLLTTHRKLNEWWLEEWDVRNYGGE